MPRRILPVLCLLASLAFSQATDTLPAPPPAPTDSVVSAKIEALGQRLDQESGTRKPSLVDGRTIGMLAVQVLLALAVVTGLGFATLFAWSRLNRRMGKGQSTLVDVLETRTLQPGRHFHLIRIHNRVVAVVTTAHGAATVTEFTDHEAAEIVAELGAGSVTARDFGATLDTLLERFKRPNQDRQG